jgi:tRNA threonylcarbamoyladenosine biosynthesis protein TsaB
MKILSLNTATPSCSASVTDADALLAEITVTTGQSHSRHVMTLIQQVIERSGISLGAIDGFAVSRGPGTFTGLRIGISAIKGIAAALGKPVVGVSSLKALAMPVASDTRLACPLLDARKGEVYLGCFKLTGGLLIRQGKEGVLPPESISRVIEGPCVFVGPGASLYRDVIAESMGASAGFAPSYHNILRASSLGWLARDRLERAENDDLEDVVPVYIRKPDAELNRKSEHS